MKHLLFTILTTILCSSCTYHVSPSSVKTRYTYHHMYKENRDFDRSKWRKSKILTEYIKYDKQGNEVEIGEYGEIWYFREVTTNPDSSIIITSGHGSYPKKLNMVMYKTYNDSNQVVTEEKWKYRDNKKDYLVYRTEYSYLNGELVQETEYDSAGEITREKSYDTRQNVAIDDRKKAMYQPLLRISGVSKDSIRYDSTGRPVEKYQYHQGKFLRRTVWVYNDLADLVTTYLYDDQPDNLWSYTEIRYDFLSHQPLRKYWKVLNSRTETKEIYLYNRKKLLKKRIQYKVNLNGRDEIESYQKFRYRLY